jgi:hypothetical protein
MPPGTGRQVDFGRKFSRVFASDPRAIEVKPISDHVFLIIPLRQETKVETSHGDTYTNYRTLLYGNSDVFVYDDAGNLMGTVEVIVDQSAVRKPPPEPDPLAELPPVSSTINIYGLEKPKRLTDGHVSCSDPSGSVDCYHVATPTR